MLKDELATLLQREFRSLASKLDFPDDFADACDNAARDTGWSFPLTSDFQIKWMKERGKRHLFYLLLTASASQVKAGSYSLNQRFDHYSRLVKELDEAFEGAKEEDVAAFAGVGAVHLFGTKVDAGFRYESQTGRDLTYSDDNKVILSPKENA